MNVSQTPRPAQTPGASETAGAPKTPQPPEQPNQPQASSPPQPPQTKEDQAYQRLKALIMVGELPRGEFLSQRMLAEKCGANVVTVRAALRQLENDRLIENVPQWGVRVPEETADTVRDRYFLREILELGAVRRIVHRREQIQPARLFERAHACDELSAQPGSDFQIYALRHYEFHQALTDLSGSQLLAQAYARLWMRSLMLWNAQRGWFRGYDRSPRLHQDLAQAILGEDEEDAVAAMVEHIRHGMQLELDALGEGIES
jgi:DNA-binding GntR family transcriptional regulator